MKKYFISEEDFFLEQVVSRIKSTDLVPSIAPIKYDIEKNVTIIKRAGVENLAELRKALKNKKNICDFSQRSGIDESYLVLFRREIEGWVIKPMKIDVFNWLDEELINTLHEIDLGSTDEIYHKLSRDDEKHEIAKKYLLHQEDLDYILALSTITRIRWVSPVVARMLIELGYNTIEDIQKTHAEKLYKEIEELNSTKKYYKGKIGERDIKRLIQEACYV